MSIGIFPASPDPSSAPVGAENQEVVHDTVGTTSASLLAARATRVSALVRNLGQKSRTIYVGPTDPTTASNGVPISGGETYAFTFVGELFVVGSHAGIPVVTTDEYN